MNVQHRTLNIEHRMKNLANPMNRDFRFAPTSLVEDPGLSALQE
jgi:hypothetical protein